MTFWLDAHLDPEVAPWLGGRFDVAVKALRELDLADAEDVVLFDAERRFGDIVIVTTDADFAEVVQQRGPPPWVVWLGCGNFSTIEVEALFSTGDCGT
jgi:predicted nuclease of predicted toxin-antitoxin system